MLSTYQAAVFAEPENPVMRAVTGLAVMPSAGAGVGDLQNVGLGCACGIKPFGLGLANDPGLRLYGDIRGRGGMRINGDPIASLGSYWRVPRGMGDVGTFIGNLTSGNFSDALSGNDFFGGIPNWVAVGAGIWFLFTINSQQRNARRSVGRTVARIKSRRKGSTKTDWSASGEAA
jgi:hypothetical protein